MKSNEVASYNKAMDEENKVFKVALVSAVRTVAEQLEQMNTHLKSISNDLFSQKTNKKT